MLNIFKSSFLSIFYYKVPVHIFYLVLLASLCLLIIVLIFIYRFLDINPFLDMLWKVSPILVFSLYWQCLLKGSTFNKVHFISFFFLLWIVLLVLYSRKLVLTEGLQIVALLTFDPDNYLSQMGALCSGSCLVGSLLMPVACPPHCSNQMSPGYFQKSPEGQNCP